MKLVPKFSQLSLARQTDPFYSEYSSFERDVHILILGTLEAARTRLKDEFERDRAQLTDGLDEAAIAQSERLSDAIAELQWHFHDQERFLLNMAAVGLASRLLHALHQMGHRAESFSPFNPPKDGKYPGKSEFGRLWAEFKERLDLDVTANPSGTEFIQRLYEVRNRIVHHGGIANPLKHNSQGCLIKQERGKIACDVGRTLDLGFSKAYPEFVEGRGLEAEVSVSQEQLDSMATSALELVKWCAKQIRERELVHAKSDDEANPGRRVF